MRRKAWLLPAVFSNLETYQALNIWISIWVVILGNVKVFICKVISLLFKSLANAHAGIYKYSALPISHLGQQLHGLFKVPSTTMHVKSCLRNIWKNFLYDTLGSLSAVLYVMF